jgi:hypothetical protein
MISIILVMQIAMFGMIASGFRIIENRVVKAMDNTTLLIKYMEHIREELLIIKNNTKRR